MWDVVGLLQGLRAGLGGAGAHPGSLNPVLMLFLHPAVSYIVSWGGGVCWEESLLGPSLWGESQQAGLPVGVWWALEGEQEGGAGLCA